MKTVACIQSSYLPWRGYFDIIRRSDAFVFHDDIQYTKQDWRNRNRVKTSRGLIWLSVPVMKATTHGTIDEVAIDNTQDWGGAHWRRIKANYRSAPFFADYSDFFESTFSTRWTHLSRLNIFLTTRICEMLGIKTELLLSRSLGLAGAKTDRLVDLCRKLGATHYLSGPSASSYLETDKLSAQGIKTSYIQYSYLAYPQQFGSFIEGASIVDVLFNCGPESAKSAFGGSSTSE